MNTDTSLLGSVSIKKKYAKADHMKYLTMKIMCVVTRRCAYKRKFKEIYQKLKHVKTRDHSVMQ